MHYDLAVAALEDTAPQRLTQGPGSDDSPRWSPAGSRIAFERSNWGERANELCVIELSTRDLQCRSSSAPRGRLTPLGWYDLERIVVRTTEIRHMSA
jgi:dipeptidyl aminopeptidase/acylaminoacyl peptidase